MTNNPNPTAARQEVGRVIVGIDYKAATDKMNALFEQYGVTTSTPTPLAHECYLAVREAIKTEDASPPSEGMGQATAAAPGERSAINVPPGYVLVPQSALDWLFGAERDANGKWFHEAEDEYAAKERRWPARYWWRSHFRKLIGAAPPQPGGR